MGPPGTVKSKTGAAKAVEQFAGFSSLRLRRDSGPQPSGPQAVLLSPWSSPGILRSPEEGRPHLRFIRWLLPRFTELPSPTDPAPLGRLAMPYQPAPSGCPRGTTAASEATNDEQ